jgi:murein DD-endopeptidase MepM/ murein hydrolase activator NlpD
MRIIVAAIFAGALLSCAAAAAAQDTKQFEIRFCPASQVRTFPLESRRGVQSLLLQNVAIVNHSAAAAEIVGIDLELQNGGSAVDTRRIAGDDLTRVAASGPKLQKSGMLQAVAFQFCGSGLIADGVTLAGPALAPGEAMLMSQQPFAYRGSRDALLVRVHLRAAEHDLDVTGTIRIESAVAKTRFAFPLKGRWFAAVGPTMHTGHRWVLPEEFAYDIARLGQDDLTHRGSGARFEDYYAYGAPVLAAADGVVTMAMDDQPENPAALRNPRESLENYGARVQQIQAALLAKGVSGIAGNYIMIDHGNSEYSLYAHLKPGSVRVKVGDHIAAGTPLGKLGSSGNSTEPHLHFQVCDGPDALACAGIPVEFQNVTLPFADYPRPLQSGDVVVTN